MVTETLNPAAQAIQHYIEHKFRGRDIHTLNFRRRVAAEIPVIAFREFGALGLLFKEFGGDIPLAISYLYPNVGTKQLLYLTPESHLDPPDPDWLLREQVDEGRILTTFVHPGETVCKILTGGDPALIDGLAVWVGSGGRVYYVSQDDLSQYPQPPSKTAVIIPVTYLSPPLPKQIRSNSVDVVLETDGFAEVEEDKKEEFIYELDRILRVGGKILFREHSKSQYEIEYYGEDLLGQDYKNYSLRGVVNHQRRWLVFQKMRSAAITYRSNSNYHSTHGQKQSSILEPVQIQSTVENTVSHEPPTDIKIPKDAKPFYYLDDLAADFRVSRAIIRITLERNGYKLGHGQRGKGFDLRHNALRFLYQEYIILKEKLEAQNLGNREKSDNKNHDHGS